MVCLARACARLSLLACVASCAQGYAGDPLGEAPRPATAPGQGPSGSAGEASDGAGPGQVPQAGGAAYMGESCRMGETQPCTCSPQGTPGIRTCRYDRMSPTMGTLSECANCQDPSDDDPPDVMPAGSSGGDGRADAGRGGSGGSGGTSGSGGTGGSGGSPGSSGSGGTGGTTGGSAGACTNSCFPVGILPCRTASGRCGCTWAPGAYCF